MKHAIVSDGVVVQVQPNEDDRTVPCPGHVLPGYSFDGETWAAPQPTVTVPSNITKRQLITQCAVDGWITEQEAVAWAMSNTLPQLLESVITGLPEGARFGARVQALTLTGAIINDPLMLAVAAEAEADQAALDAFFTAAAAL